MSKSADIDLKIEVLRSENPKMDPYGIHFEHLGRPKSGGRKSSTEFSASGTPVFAGKYARLDILRTLKDPLVDPSIVCYIMARKGHVILLAIPT